MTFHLKRFNNVLMKINKHIDFPLSLNLQPFLTNN